MHISSLPHWVGLKQIFHTDSAEYLYTAEWLIRTLILGLKMSLENLLLRHNTWPFRRIARRVELYIFSSGQKKLFNTTYCTYGCSFSVLSAFDSTFHLDVCTFPASAAPLLLLFHFGFPQTYKTSSEYTTLHMYLAHRYNNPIEPKLF